MLVIAFGTEKCYIWVFGTVSVVKLDLVAYLPLHEMQEDASKHTGPSSIKLPAINGFLFWALVFCIEYAFEPG